MKLDIENKILIPFMILSILPIVILGMVSYINGYQLLFNDKVQNMKISLQEQIAYIELLDEGVQNNVISLSEAQAQAETHFKKINKTNFVILSAAQSIVNTSNLKIPSLELLTGDSTGHILEQDDLLYAYNRYEPWGWTLILGIDKSIFLDELLDIQKYILLTAIIFLVFSMQAIIFIAHNISKPIKTFAEICKRIEFNNLKEKINMNRSDEIGILAKSFNKMIDQLNVSAEHLIEMKQFNEDILKNISIGIMTTDSDGSLLTINEAGSRIFEKYRNDPQIAMALNGQILKTVAREKSVNEVIVINTVSNSKAVYLDVSTSLFRKDTDHINGVICSFNDITERKTLENDIVRVNRLASVGEFAAGLAHEIRNPLTGIKTGIQVIKSRIDSDTQSSSIELAEGISYEIDRINTLITELLDFSKPQRSKREWADMVQVLKRVIELTRESMHRKKTAMTYTVLCDNPMAFVDEAQVEQIFINIITNALDAMSEMGRLNILMDTAAIDGAPYLLTTFEDNGTGIDEEAVEKIFDPFFTTKPKGIGLGLSVVSKLTEENHGKIEIESIKNVSTTFKIYLPVRAEDDDDKNSDRR